MKRNILLTPGPTPVPSLVRQALAEPVIHHRTPQYRKIFASVSARLKKIFLTENPVYTFSGSGTSAMEAALVNFHSPHDEVLVVESGKFSERFTEIARAHRLKPVAVKVAYGEAVKKEDLQEALKKNPRVKSVCVGLCETSTAALNDIRAIGELTRSSDALLIVDAISGLGADRLETDLWNVDIAVSASQKALMLPPGLAFLTVGAKGRKRLESAECPRFYMDIRFYEKSLKAQDTPFTPAIGLVVALEKALDLMEAEGLENVFSRSARLASWTREKIQAMGLELFSKAPSSTVTAAVVPAGVDGEKLVSIMRDQKGVTIAGGQGEMKGKIIRIAHMGAITQEDLKEGISVLEETLNEMKEKVRTQA